MDSGFGITSTGFNKKSFNDLKDGFQTSLQGSDLFGADIDFSDADPLYQFSIPIIEMFSELWELAEQTFYSASPKYAEGNPLSSTGKYIGISRKQATKATGIVRFTGTPGVQIQEGFQVGTETGIKYVVTDANQSIPQSGYIDLNVIAVNPGADGNNPAGTITKAINPTIGLNSVSNVNPTIGGQDEENDPLFRTRYEESTTIGAGSTTDALRANILQITGVQDAVVLENDTMTIDSNGIPAKSFMIYVQGGNDNEIAQAIFDKKPSGIQAYGNTNVNITDSQEIIHQIGFSRATAQLVWIKVITTINSDFPSNGKTQIANVVLDYIHNIKLGENVLLYKIISAVAALNLAGLNDMAVTLSTDGSTYNDSNIAISSYEIAISDSSKISVI